MTLSNEQLEEQLEGYFFLGRTSVHEIEGALMERMMGGGEKVKDE
jgi:hypothetical protein